MNKFNNRYFNLKYLVIACFGAGFSFFTSCSPDSGIGANILPTNNLLNAGFCDTSTVVTSLVLEDTVPTNNMPSYFLGSYNDPYFGVTKASIYAQLMLPEGDGVNPFTAAGGISSSTIKVILDSVVFGLAYVNISPNYYGVLGANTVQVYLLNQSMYPDTAYYSGHNLSHGMLLGERVVTPDMTAWDSIRYPPSLPAIPSIPRFTIKLPHWWGQKWMDTALNGVIPNSPVMGQGGDSIFLNEAAFIRNVPGIYITTSDPMQFPGQGSIWDINLYYWSSGIFFYCRIINSDNTTTDTIYHIPQLGFSNLNISYSHFDHNYTTAPFYGRGPVSPKKDSVNSPDFAYVQGFGGVKTKISFPNIMNYVKKGPVIVNRAEVDIPVVAQDIGSYPPPSQLYLLSINDTSTVPTDATYSLPDQGTAYYGGTYDAFNQMYVFDIAQYVQWVLDKKIVDHGLYLVPGSSSISPGRVVLYGGAKVPGRNSNQRIRLKLYSTPLKP